MQSLNGNVASIDDLNELRADLDNEITDRTNLMGGFTMACSHVKNCELFVQFALNPALDIWKEHYCEGDYKTCVRFNKSKSGAQIPLTLLPNGTLIKEGGNDLVCGSTAVFNAILKNRARMVSSLIKIGVDINAKNIDGLTPLMATAEFGATEIARILVNNGADPHAENMYGETALDIAIKKGHQDIEKLLNNRTGATRLKTGT